VEIQSGAAAPVSGRSPDYLGVHSPAAESDLEQYFPELLCLQAVLSVRLVAADRTLLIVADQALPIAGLKPTPESLSMPV